MRIGVLTSGGDAPGMNAALRTVAAAGIGRGHTVLGIRRGYEGLLEGDTVELSLEMLSGISRMGGTSLGSARSAVFPTPEGQRQARERLVEMGLDALVVIGGNGSLAGAHLLASDRPCTIVGVPASIDNDIGHCGMAIGVDTAVNTIVDACDRISDTARAHRRAFIVEVMGRHCGFLAMRAGIAAEADAILYAEMGLDEDALVARLESVLSRCFVESSYHKRCLIIKAEGVEVPTSRIAERLREHLATIAPGVGLRETILGHVVRGGNPSGLDRTIAQRLGFAALVAAERQIHDVMAAWQVPDRSAGMETPDPEVRLVPHTEVLAETERLLNGESEVVKRRVQLLRQVESLLAL